MFSSKLQNLTRTATRLVRKNTLLKNYCSRWKITYDVNDILSNKEISIYRRLFDKMDSNRDGFLTKEDLGKGLKDYVNYSASEEELQETMETLDTDKDGSIGFDEFIRYIAWSRQMRTEEAIKYAFDAFDKNKDGLINKDELREALVSLGLVPNESLLNNIMLLSDRNSNGTINYDEFKRVFYGKDLTE